MADVERAHIILYLGAKVQTLKKHAHNNCGCDKTHTPTEMAEYGYASHVVAAMASDIDRGMHLD